MQVFSIERQLASAYLEQNLRIIIKAKPVKYLAVAFLAVSFLALSILGLSNQAAAQTYYLGVLAPQGEVAAQQRWQPWLSELNKTLKDDTIVLVPLELDNWQQQIEAQKFAFVLGPQVQFVKMDTMGWRWLATLKTDTKKISPNTFKISDVTQSDFKTDAQYELYKKLENQRLRNQQAEAEKIVAKPSAMEQIASALWVKVDSNIEQPRDLQQRKIVAVAPDAFAGYLLIAHLLQQNGLRPEDYETQFVGYPIELTLSMLASGAVEAAIAPLCLMEEMAAQGKIDQSQYRLISPVTTESSCQSSTKIYPNWTLAATREAPAVLTEQLNRYLFAANMQSVDSQANAATANSTELRWMPPESNSDAERILYEMGQHPAQKLLGEYILEWIKSHRWWMSSLVFIVLISTINYAWMSWLAWRRRQQILAQNRLIRDYDQQLRQSERFAVIGEMSGAIAHEINQPLATIQNYAQGLLIRSQHHQTDNPVIHKRSTEKALEQIINETQRAAAVIKNIRHWAGRSQASEVSVDIAATYEQCILLLGDKALGINFWFASDHQQLQLPNLLLDQLLINTMLNAQQQGATNIMLRCQRQEDEDLLILHVTDDAGGFNEDQLINNQTRTAPQPYLKHPYTLRSTKAEGLGLGLMICQRLCKSVHGKVMIDSVNVSKELTKIKNIAGHYQHRLKPANYSKTGVSQVSNTSDFTDKMGAQVSFYLPISIIVG